jgi:hypothetical protein
VISLNSYIRAFHFIGKYGLRAANYKSTITIKDKKYIEKIARTNIAKLKIWTRRTTQVTDRHWASCVYIYQIAEFLSFPVELLTFTKLKSILFRYPPSTLFDIEMC